MSPVLVKLSKGRYEGYIMTCYKQLKHVYVYCKHALLYTEVNDLHISVHMVHVDSIASYLLYMVFNLVTLKDCNMQTTRQFNK